MRLLVDSLEIEKYSKAEKTEVFLNCINNHNIILENLILLVLKNRKYNDITSFKLWNDKPFDYWKNSAGDTLNKMPIDINIWWDSQVSYTFLKKLKKHWHGNLVLLYSNMENIFQNSMI